MSVKLVMLKSGEDIIADVKELKTEEGIVGYYFHNPLIVKTYHPEEPTVLNEEGCLLYTSPSPRDMRRSRMPSSA